MLSVPAWPAVDINTADAKTLEKLAGIGPAKAQAILDYRSKNGPFKSKEDLRKVDGIGEKTYEAIADEITVGGSAPAKTP
ncbi:MAG TPA: helix-hairpin-helix domain-containing protein [Nevskiaceae bacterium]|nr:helix-hairpin-helix domain-containing protein [Nevskiaceae bacterium]